MNDIRRFLECWGLTNNYSHIGWKGSTILKPLSIGISHSGMEGDWIQKLENNLLCFPELPPLWDFLYFE